MHLLDSWIGRWYAVTGGVKRKEGERREVGKSGDVAGLALTGRELGRARLETGAGALKC